MADVGRCLLQRADYLPNIKAKKAQQQTTETKFWLYIANTVILSSVLLPERFALTIIY